MRIRKAKLAALAGAWLLLAPLSGPRARSQEPAKAIHSTPRAQLDADRVDINHASVEKLMKVPGMTRSWATRIVRFRPYRTKLDLVDHGIVSPAVYGRIKEYVIAHRDKQ